MTADLAETRLWHQNLASLIRSGLFSKAATGEANGLFTVVGVYKDETCSAPPGEVLGFETGRRRRQSRQLDRSGARGGRVELISSSPPTGKRWVCAIVDRHELLDASEFRVTAHFSSVRSLRPRHRPRPPSCIVGGTSKLCSRQWVGSRVEKPDRGGASTVTRRRERSARTPAQGAPGNVRGKGLYKKRGEAG